jgi:hypothetical protein
VHVTLTEHPNGVTVNVHGSTGLHHERFITRNLDGNLSLESFWVKCRNLKAEPHITGQLLEIVAMQRYTTHAKSYAETYGFEYVKSDEYLTPEGT